MHKIPDRDDMGGAGGQDLGSPPAVPSFEDGAGDRTAASSRPLGPITVDWKLYEHHLAASDLTDDQKREFLEALWYILITFVDLGFGIEPVQQVMTTAATRPPVRSESPVARRRQDSGLEQAFGKANAKQTIKGDHPEGR